MPRPKPAAKNPPTSQASGKPKVGGQPRNTATSRSGKKPVDGTQSVIPTLKKKVVDGGGAGSATRKRDVAQTLPATEPAAKSRPRRNPMVRQMRPKPSRVATDGPLDPTAGGRYCGAKLGKRVGTCRHKAGWATDHVGNGRCKNHGGLTPVKHGRYSSVTRPRLQNLIASFESDPDPLNLLPELALMRAVILDFIERYDEMHEGLMRWQLTFNKSFMGDWQKWWSEVQGEAVLHGTIPDTPAPDPMSYPPGKPITILDLSTAAGMLAQVGALTDRINKMREDKTFSMATIARLYEVMGADLEQTAREVITDDAARERLLDTVEARWRGIQLTQLAGRGTGKNA